MLQFATEHGASYKLEFATDDFDWIEWQDYQGVGTIGNLLIAPQTDQVPVGFIRVRQN